MFEIQRIQQYLRQLDTPLLRSHPLQPQIYGFDHQVSTNQTAWSLVQQGAPEGTVVVAAQQTAGRGQWGRQWQSDLGGVYLSMVLNPQLPSQSAGQLTLASAWGMAASFNQNGIPVHLKWPNDLILQGRKLGGILTETRIRQGTLAHAVIGVGVNGFNPVPKTGVTLQAYLADADLTPVTQPLREVAQQRLEGLVAVVIHGIHLGYGRLQQAGMTSLLEDYNRLICHRGQEVQVDGHSGTVVGVTVQGRLRVQLSTQPGVMHLRDVDPGDVQLGYPGGE